ncbi:MAG: glucosamine-6-phosphate deaminase [Tannerellaceae bacterium]|jgi:glucosamine-6-phosphate deaminase|nr:glucosamine-6-phosphate deaminase [Tannerellaceae bacterium]
MKLSITIATNEKEFDRMAAWRITGEILNNPKAVIGLSTGQTTRNMYAIISDIYKLYPFDVSSVTLFGVDEVANVSRAYDGACYTMLRKQLIDTLGVRPENFIMPPTLSDDFERECRLFQEELEKRGGVDLQILGLGANGHLGFNQPGTPFESETWLSDMDEVLEERIRKETGTPPGKKLGGLTLGVKNIMHARKILLVAKGSHKAGIVKKMLEGPVDAAIPASVLQLHPNCEFLLDQEAASQLKTELY